MAEFDCKPGPIRDRIGELQAEWLSTLHRAAADAVRPGELRDDTDAEQLTFDLEAALLSANWYLHLFDNQDYLERAGDPSAPGSIGTDERQCRTTALPTGNHRQVARRRDGEQIWHYRSLGAMCGRSATTGV